MSTRAEVENHIRSSWVDETVAKWVIKRLPLLEKGFTHPSCPIYNLSLEKGLTPENEPALEWKDFKERPKYVISGGFEGTSGHLLVISEMMETRALTADWENSLVVLMIEPDDYIRLHKKREPLVNIEQRKQLWSTSGLVDAVIILPRNESNVSNSEHYNEVHRHIAPAAWCVNIENPHYFEVVNRGREESAYDLIRIYSHAIEVHTSFLDSTKRLKPEEVKKELRTYLINLILSDRYDTLTRFISPEREAEIFMQRIAKGL